MRLNGEPVPARHFLLQALNIAILKFYDLSARGADEVIVVSLVGDVVVLSLASEMPSLGQACLAKEIQGPVDGRQSDVRILLGEHAVHLLRRNVFRL